MSSAMRAPRQDQSLRIETEAIRQSRERPVGQAHLLPLVAGRQGSEPMSKLGRVRLECYVQKLDRR